jgi:hypothetical protein
MPRFFRALAAASQVGLVACGNAEVGNGTASTIEAVPSLDGAHERIEVRANPPSEPGQESYLCFVVDGAPLAGHQLESVTWSPGGGPVLVHHATLSALGEAGPLGEVDCEQFPTGASVIHVYTPGAGALKLPKGVALQLGPDTERLRVELHLLRASPGEAAPIIVDLGLLSGSAEHVAAWVDDYAPVPPLVPQVPATETGSCRFPAPGRLIYSWPHMHQSGASFEGAMIRADGTRETLIEVPSWDFEHQLMYPLDVPFEAGDSMQTSCSWLNTTDEIVFPGPYSFQEMCNQGLYVWPPEAARCEP